MVFLLWPIYRQYSSTFLHFKMLLRIAKVSLAVVLSLMFTISLWKITYFLHNIYFNESVEHWLNENGLGKYKELFRESGKFNSHLTIYM